MSTRGKGIYFRDEEYEALVEESAYASLERGRPVSVSALVREAVIDFVKKRREERDKAGLVGGQKKQA